MLTCPLPPVVCVCSGAGGGQGLEKLQGHPQALEHSLWAHGATLCPSSELQMLLGEQRPGAQDRGPRCLQTLPRDFAAFSLLSLRKAGPRIVVPGPAAQRHLELSEITWKLWACRSPVTVPTPAPAPGNSDAQ